MGDVKECSIVVNVDSIVESGYCCVGLSSSRIFVERNGGLIQSSRVPLRRVVIIHVVNLQLRTKRCKTMTAEADSIKSLIKVEKHGSFLSWFY